MSGLTPPNDQPPLPETPLALTDLARSLDGVSPSPHVERALEAAWGAMHASTDARQVRHRRSWVVWTAPALAAAAALLVATAWVGWTNSTLDGPDDPQHVGVEAAVPGGPFEPPPPVAPAGTRMPVRPDLRDNTPAASRRVVPPPGPPSRRPDTPARSVVRPAQGAVGDDPEPFVWLRGADDIEPGLGVHVVRVQVPRLRWDGGTPSRELVDADVLMGNDGQARAVRVVRTGRQ